MKASLHRFIVLEFQGLYTFDFFRMSKKYLKKKLAAEYSHLSINADTDSNDNYASHEEKIDLNKQESFVGKFIL